MKIGIGLGISRWRKSGAGFLIVNATITTINPFAATASPPSGYQFIAGAITINIPAKPETFGVATSVPGAITTAGAITENTAGDVQAAIQAGGWTEGDDVSIGVSGATYDVYVSPGPVVALASVSRVGDPTSSNIILHPSIPVTMPPRDLVAFYTYRGIGNINGAAFTFNGTAMTEVAAAVAVNTSGRTGARKLTNPNNVSSGSVSMTGLSTSTSNASTMALLSIDDSDLFNMTVFESAASASVANVTVSVLPGDVLVSIVNWFGTGSTTTSVVWAGTTQISGPAQCGTQPHYSAVAMQTITSTDAAYVVGASLGAAKVNLAHSVLRIRKA